VRVGTNTGDERLFSYHRVGALPVYAMVAMPTAAIFATWTGTVLVHMAYALPACVALVLLALFALRQARRERAAIEAAAIEAARAEAAETRLRHAPKLEALGSLTGGVAHDINNLLTVVRGNAGVLRAALPPQDARSRRRLEAILEAAERGTTLTRRLLAFARRQPLRQETLDPAERLPALADTLRSALRGDISLAIEAPPGTWPVAIDPEELELALLNLATNARDAMPAGGRVRIVAANQRLGPGDPPGGRAGEFVRITVVDTGAGIPAAALARVFEPFFTTTPVGAGTGLGRSQVYGIARQSGGGA
jgi:two-component system NtrC family sensor kinase